MDIKITITSIFMVPTLGIPKKDLTDNGFINGYSRDASRDVEYDDAVYLLFQPKNILQFKEFLDNEYEHAKQIIEDYNLDKGFVVVVYKLDPSYKVDFNLIRQGKYSKTSPSFQKLFPKTKKINIKGVARDDISLQYRIFNQTKDLITFWEEKLGMTLEKDQEVWSAYVEENEILNFDKIKEIIES